MRFTRHLALFVLLLIVMFIERAHPLTPITWFAVGLVLIRGEVPLVLIASCTLFADVALALPLGMSALACAGISTLLQHAPRKMLARGIFFAFAGAATGVVSGALRHTLTPGLVCLSAIVCAALYMVGSSTPSFEEIGHVQE